MSQAWSHMFLNLHHNSFQTKERLERMVDQNGGKFECSQNLFKKDAFYPNQIIFVEVQ